MDLAKDPKFYDVIREDPISHASCKWGGCESQVTHLVMIVV